MYDKNATGPEAVRTFLQMTILDGRWGPPQSDDEEEAIVLRGIVRSALAGDISMGNLTLGRALRRQEAYDAEELLPFLSGAKDA
jgi:hypothetical protein